MPDPQQLGPSTRPPRGLGLFRALSRRLGRKNSSDSPTAKDTPKEDSSSENKENSEIEKRLQENNDRPPQIKKKQVSLNLTDSSDKSSDRTSDKSSDRTSDTSSDRTNEREGVAILSSVLRRLSLGSATSSKKKKQPKSILRRPVCHVYVRGISGLPTQRVPVSRTYYRQPHRHMQYSP